MQGYDSKDTNALLINPWRKEVRKRSDELVLAVGESKLEEIMKRNEDEEIGEYAGSYEREVRVLLHYRNAFHKLGTNQQGQPCYTKPHYFLLRLFNLGTHWHYLLKTSWDVPHGGISRLWGCGFNRPGITRAKHCTRTACPFCHLFMSVFPIYSALWNRALVDDATTLQTFSIALPSVYSTYACDLVDGRGVSEEVYEQIKKPIEEQIEQIRTTIRNATAGMGRRHIVHDGTWVIVPEVVVCNRKCSEYETLEKINPLLEDRLNQRGRPITAVSLRRMQQLWRKRAVIRLVVKYAQVLQPHVKEGWAQALSERIYKLYGRNTAWLENENDFTCHQAAGGDEAEVLNEALTPFAHLDMSWMNGIELYCQLHSFTSHCVGGNISRRNFHLPSLEELKEWQSQNRKLKQENPQQLQEPPAVPIEDPLPW
jgi:hypothetical protein